MALNVGDFYTQRARLASGLPKNACKVLFYRPIDTFFPALAWIVQKAPASARMTCEAHYSKTSRPGDVMKKMLSRIAAGVALCLVAAASHATIFTFTQSGFSGGGALTGTFTGTDLNSDGYLSTFSNEISDYSMVFSGDAIINDFSHTFIQLSGLVYELGSGFIGDGFGGGTEGVASNWGGVSGYDYASGLGPTGTTGGRVIDTATGAISATQNLVAVAQVPEPATLALLGLGLAGLGISRRRKAI